MLLFFFLILRRPPRYTRTATLLPDTTLFRSWLVGCGGLGRAQIRQAHRHNLRRSCDRALARTGWNSARRRGSLPPSQGSRIARLYIAGWAATLRLSWLDLCRRDRSSTGNSQPPGSKAISSTLRLAHLFSARGGRSRPRRLERRKNGK